MGTLCPGETKVGTSGSPHTSGGFQRVRHRGAHGRQTPQSMWTELLMPHLSIVWTWVLPTPGQEWLRCLICERWELRSNPYGKQCPFLPGLSTPNPLGGHTEKYMQSVYKIGQLCRKNCSQMHCSLRSLAKYWTHGKKRKCSTQASQSSPHQGREASSTVKAGSVRDQSGMLTATLCIS